MRNIMKSVGTLGILGCVVTFSSSALAEDSGWYGGGNIGATTRAEIDDPRIAAELKLAGFTMTSIIDDNRGNGYKLYGGYRVNENFALEGGYFNLGKYGFRSTAVTTAIPAVPGTLTGSIKIQGVNFDIVGIVPITERFSAFGRLGLNYAQARDAFVGTGSVTVTNPNPSKNALNYKFGAGLGFNFSPALGMRLEAERYRINDAVGNKGDIDMYSLGLVYRFGVEKPTPPPPLVQRELKPERVIVEAKAVPVIVPIPVPSPRRKMVFAADSSVDSLFDFNKSTVKPGGKVALDKFISELNGTSYDLILVTGHTDRIGSDAYNKKLSTERAEAVKAYLVEFAHVPAEIIQTSGKYSSEPITQPGECVGKKRTQKLIACLAPDRRVEVEVTATSTTR